MHAAGRRAGGVGSVAAACYEDTANTWDMMARVEGVLLST